MIDLYWIPLGAGGHSVRFNGLVYEAIAAARGRRARQELFHAALVVDGRGIEVGPVRGGGVAAGAVGSRLLGWLRLFRYEVRCGPPIPDLAYAAGRCRVSEDPAVAARVLALVRAVPTPVWGRDELRAGEMWTSNSVVAWLLACAGAALPVPPGRAPGWDAGLVVARRQSGCGSCTGCTTYEPTCAP